MKPLAIGLCVGFSLVFCLSARASELDGILKNNAGVKKFNGQGGDGKEGAGGEHAFEAFGDFTGALADLPYSSVVHFNIGNSFLRNKEFEKALSEYKQTLLVEGQTPRGSDPTATYRLNALDAEARFRALFNSGVAFTELKKTPEALEAYQAALEIIPDSVETKTNIELLTAGGGGEGQGEDKDKDQKDQKDQDKKDGKDNKDKQKDKKDSPGQQNEKKNDPKQQPDKVDNPRPSPHPFKSEDLTQQDVKRILEELKRQEEQIRTRMENDQSKEPPPGKDW